MNLHLPLALRDLWEGLRSTPLRSAIAFTALTLSMSSLTLLLAFTSGLKTRGRTLVAELGAGVFGILATDTAAPASAAHPLQEGDLARLRSNLDAVATTGLRLLPASAGLPPGVQVLGSDADLLRVRPWPLLAGRALDPEDLRLKRPVALVSAALRTAHGYQPGDIIRIGRRPHTIVGIFDPGSTAPTDATPSPTLTPGERVVLIPRSLPDLATPQPPAQRRLDAIFIKTADAAALRHAIPDARRLLDAGFEPRPRLTWITPEGLVTQLERWQRLLTVVGGAIVTLGFLLAGATLTSLLLANLTQRLPEIGLRRAIGASATDIGRLFLAEALTLTIAAAIAGAGATALLLHTRAATLPPSLPISTSPNILLLPGVAGILLGALCALWPALLAARMPPAEALRNG